MEVNALRVLGKNLNRIRTSVGLTQEKLAEKASISLRYVQQLEVGQRSPRVSTLVKLKAALGCTYDDLFRTL